VGVNGPGQRVVVDAWSRLICAGWVPQDRVFGGNVAAGLGSGVTLSWTRMCLWDRAAHSLGAGRSARWRSGSLTPTVSSRGARQGPGLTGDRNVRDDRAFAALGVGYPPMMQPVVTRLRSSHRRGRGQFPPAAQDPL